MMIGSKIEKEMIKMKKKAERRQTHMKVLYNGRELKAPEDVIRLKESKTINLRGKTNN